MFYQCEQCGAAVNTRTAKRIANPDVVIDLPPSPRTRRDRVEAYGRIGREVKLTIATNVALNDWIKRHGYNRAGGLSEFVEAAICEKMQRDSVYEKVFGQEVWA